MRPENTRAMYQTTEYTKKWTNRFEQKIEQTPHSIFSLWISILTVINFRVSILKSGKTTVNTNGT